MQWEIFNEGDCVRHFNVTEMVEFTRAIDPHRLIDAHSGGDDHAGGDVNDIHTCTRRRLAPAPRESERWVGAED